MGKIGKGNKVKFWEDVWITQEPLKICLPRLYIVSKGKNKNIVELGDEWTKHDNET